MSSYTKPLQTSYHSTASKLFGRDMWVVKQGFRYFIGSENSNEYVDIPLGFLTDGASIPRIFWNILPPWGKYGQATVVHDYLCEHGEIIKQGRAVPITRKRTDKIFKEAMQVLQVPKWEVFVMSTAVNLYRKLTRKKEPELLECKALTEQMIKNNSVSGFFELTDEQINFIKNQEKKSDY